MGLPARQELSGFLPPPQALSPTLFLCPLQGRRDVPDVSVDFEQVRLRRRSFGRLCPDVRQGSYGKPPSRRGQCFAEPGADMLLRESVILA